ncbi:multidrug efflux SMR transporter [Methanogenium sp. MK-MG]|uniref:DMT family transporter n=1 Tax=Methanogenium sp. MK-MG TaxID=2599926 RepID=UPI0013EC8057|nr:multidrug efflux SMR transporter [Methanogenium sp. MK-MG]KAF1076168.1 Spermidine export protein MdtJ [Methanogenium sp. MK-MG]
MFGPWGLLGAGVVLEVVGTTCLKLSEGFTKAIPSVCFAACFAAAFYLFSRALSSMEVGIAYAVWAGFGITGITLVGVLFFHEDVSLVKFAGISLIIAGAALLNLSANAA